MLTELTNQNYNEVFPSEKPLVVDSIHPSCTHCSATEPDLTR